MAEILLLDSVSLGRLAGPDDFIVSQHLVSLTIAQLSEYRKRKWVFDALLLRGDAEVTLHPCETYGIGSAVTFEELVDRGRQRGIIVIGWQTSRRQEDGKRTARDIVLNPSRDQVVRLEAGDQIIAFVPSAAASRGGPGGLNSDYRAGVTHRRSVRARWSSCSPRRW